MGRRLTPSERRQRDRERERRAAARRAKTAARRSREKEAREKERSRQKAAKEAKTEKEIQENRKIQKVFDRYLEDINSFHKEYKPRKFVGSFEYRQRTRKYEATPPPENKEFSWKEFSWKEYKRKPFESKAFKWKDYKKTNYNYPKLKEETKVATVFWTNKKILWSGYIAAVVWVVIGGFFGQDEDSTYLTAAALFCITSGALYLKRRKNLSASTNQHKLLVQQHHQKHDKLKKEHDTKEKTKQQKDQTEKEKAKQEHEKARLKALAEHDKKEEEKEKEDKKAKNKAQQENEEAKNKAQQENEEQNKQKQNKHKKQEEKKKKTFDVNEEKRKSVLQKAEQGSIEEIEIIIESILPLEHKLETPKNMPNETEINNTEVGYNVIDAKTIHIVYEIPDLDSIIPAHKYSITPKGTTLKISDMSERQTNNTKNNFVCSMAFHHALEILKAYPFFEQIVFEAKYTGIETSTGKDKDITVLLIHIETEKMLNELNLDKIPEIEDAIVNFDYQFSKYGSKPKDITSTINKEEIVWSTPNKEDKNIPYGLNPKERKKQLPNR
jgi:hypothetical protein